MSRHPRFAGVAVVALAAACAGCLTGDPNAGQSGTEIPDGCYETSRSTVTDPAEIPEGFDYSFGEVLDAIGGAWAGSLSAGGNDVAATLELSWTGEPVDAVVREWVTHNNGGGDPLPMGAPEPVCANGYSIPLSASLDATPFASADVPTRLESRPFLENVDQRTAFALYGMVGEADVAGTAEPTFDPGDWDHIFLGLGADAVDGTLTGNLNWIGTRDPSGVPNTVEPSITSPAGALQLSAPAP